MSMATHNASRPSDASSTRPILVASFAPETGNVWSNPELTCQHVDPQTSLSPNGRAIVETKLLIFHGSLDEALKIARKQRHTLRLDPRSSQQK
jgi:hypothetical protein